jgi:hypothetical protein
MLTSRSHLGHLVLKDLPITEDGLYALWLELDCHKKSAGAVWWWPRLKHRIMLRLGCIDQIYVLPSTAPSASPRAISYLPRIKIDFLLSTCMPPRILEELVQLSHHADCSGPRGFDLSRVRDIAGYNTAQNIGLEHKLWLRRQRLSTMSVRLDELVREIQGLSDIDLSKKGQESAPPLKGLTDPEVRWLFTLLSCSLSTKWRLSDCGLSSAVQLQMLAAGMGRSNSLTQVRSENVGE